ncbi:MAG: hypothetical protein HQK49_10555 [Oligoflexia bacterium]|nr:hypothetical protein [Oligoflexia bacterium]
MSFFSKKYISGMSLMEVMIAAGMMSAVSVGFLTMTSNQNKVVKNLESSADITSTKAIMDQILLDGDACRRTLALAGAIVGASGTSTIPRILNREGNEVLVVGTTYNNTIRISRIAIEFDGTLVPNSFNLIRLVTTFEKTASILAISSEVAQSPNPNESPATTTTTTPTPNIKTTMIRAFLDNSLTVTSCFNDIGAAVETAKQQSCEMGGGDYTPTSGQCWFSSNPTADLQHVAPVQYVRNNFLRVDGTNPMTGDLWVSNNIRLGINGNINASGTIAGVAATAGSISGATITSSGAVTAGSNFCIGSTCRNFAAQTCSTSQVMTGIQTSGAPSCTTALTCLSTQYLRGITSGGGPNCADIPTSQCGAGKYATKIETDGTVSCDVLPDSALTCTTNQFRLAGSCVNFGSTMGSCADANSFLAGQGSCRSVTFPATTTCTSANQFLDGINHCKTVDFSSTVPSCSNASEAITGSGRCSYLYARFGSEGSEISTLKWGQRDGEWVGCSPTYSNSVISSLRVSACGNGAEVHPGHVHAIKCKDAYITR